MNEDMKCETCRYKNECANYTEERKEWLCLSWKQGHGVSQLNLFGEDDEKEKL